MANLDKERLLNACIEYGAKMIEEQREKETADAAEKKMNSDDMKDVDMKTMNALKTLISMIRDVAAKEYDVPVKTMVLTIGAVAYLVSPIDVIPDVIPGVGYTDDVTVVSLVVKSCYDDIVAYKKWKEEKTKEAGGEEADTDKAEPVLAKQDTSTGASANLDAYLMKNFGDNIELQNAEIERLAQLCYDNSVTDVRKRAEIALADLS